MGYARAATFHGKSGDPVHSTFGFFMNWTGTQKGEGFEYHLLALAITAFLMIRGAGALSVDRTIVTASPARQSELVRS